jgi:hypothetical protein
MSGASSTSLHPSGRRTATTPPWRSFLALGPLSSSTTPRYQNVLPGMQADAASGFPDHIDEAK